jgi:hypothetical protein
MPPLRLESGCLMPPPPGVYQSRVSSRP